MKVPAKPIHEYSNTDRNLSGVKDIVYGLSQSGSVFTFL